MQASLALLGKELVHMRRHLLWLMLFSLVTTWINFVVMNRGGGVLSYLSLATTYAMPLLVLVVFVLAQQIVVSEYRAGTQKFIEGLPVRRVQVALIKYLTGLGLVLAFALAALGAAIWLARGHESVAPWFSFLMSARIVFYCLALWTGVFALSLLGRLRIPVIGAVVIFFLFLDAKTTFELNRFGPLALVNDELFTSERVQLPWRDILQSLAITLVAAVLAAILLFRHEGSMAERLATPMTRGEKTCLFILAFMGLSLLGYMSKDEPDPVPYLGSEQIVERGRVVIAYLEPGFEQDAAALANHLEAVDTRIDDVLSLPVSFRVRLSLTPGVEGHEFETSFLDATHGVHLTANFTGPAPGFHSYFSAYVVHQVLFARSTRFTLEPLHAMTDGFAQWISGIPPHAAVDDVPMVQLQALYATQILPVTAANVRRWDATSEVLGDSLGLSWAYSAWWVLERQVGREAALEFARAEFDRKIHGDVRDWWHEFNTPQAQRFEAATGLAWDAFLELWAAELARLRARPAYRRALQALPRGTVTFTADAKGSASIRVSARLDRPLGADSQCYILHGRVPGYEAPSSHVALQSTPIPVGARQFIDHAFRGFYGKGTRVLIALECEFPQFPLPIRLGNARVTL